VERSNLDILVEFEESAELSLLDYVEDIIKAMKECCEFCGNTDYEDL
jgi:predicted nucleotidyltransferase